MSEPSIYPTSAAFDLLAEVLSGAPNNLPSRDRERETAFACLMDETASVLSAAGIEARTIGVEQSAKRSLIVHHPSNGLRFRVDLRGSAKVVGSRFSEGSSEEPERDAELTWDRACARWLGPRVLGADGRPLRDGTRDGAPFVRESAVAVIVELVLAKYRLWLADTSVV